MKRKKGASSNKEKQDNSKNREPALSLHQPTFIDTDFSQTRRFPPFHSAKTILSELPDLLLEHKFPIAAISISQSYCLDSVQTSVEFFLLQQSGLEETDIQVVIGYLIDEGLRTILSAFFSTRIQTSGDHLIALSAKGYRNRTGKSPKFLVDTGSDVREHINVLYHRFKFGDHESSQFDLRKCPVTGCIDHGLLVRKSQRKVPIDKLPYPSALDDELFDFRSRVYARVDWEESRIDGKGCFLLNKSLYRPNDPCFRDPPQFSLWNHSVLAHRALLALYLKQIPQKGMSTRHNPIVCNNPRCVNITHLLGFGSAKDQANDKRRAGTCYQDFAKRKKVEKLIEERKSNKYVVRQTGYSFQQVRKIRRQLKGTERTRTIPKDTPEYREKFLKKIWDRVEIKDTCWTMAPKFLITVGKSAGRPKRMNYLGRNRAAYTINFGLRKNNGIVPDDTLIMHNDDPNSANYCKHRPNCVNADHLDDGTRSLNNQRGSEAKAEYSRRRKRIFSESQAEQMNEFCAKGYTGKKIRTFPTFEQFTCRQLNYKISHIKNKLLKKDNKG